MTPPTLLQRLLFAALTPFQLLRLFFRRNDAGGDVYPADASSGIADGRTTTALRLTVVGDRGEISLGVLSHEMGNAGFIARRLAGLTDASVRWSIVGVRSARLRDARATIAAAEEELEQADAVVLLIGITDTLSMSSVSGWERNLHDALATLRLRIPPHAVVAVADIPPLDNAGSLSRPARAVAGAHGRAINESTRRVVARHENVFAVPFPAELTRDLWLPRSIESRYLHTYEVWGATIGDAVADAIDQTS